MQKTLYSIVCLFISAFLYSCDGGRTEALVSIETLEKKVYKDSLKTLNTEVAVQLSDACIGFVNEFPKDEKAPDMLFKAASINNSLLLFEPSVHLYRKLYTDYPEHKRAAVCLFLSAFISENYLHNLERAKSEYTLFLEKHPKHELAKDVKFSLQHLGKNDEELLKEFKTDTIKKSNS